MSIKCDVLYIHPTKNPLSLEQPSYAIMPMGIIGILNGFRAKGVDVYGFNIAVEQHLNPEFDLTAALADIEYKVLVTDLHWYVHSFGAMYVVECSKKVKPEIPVVIGGYTSTIYPLEIMEKFSGVDYIVTGDSDLPMDMLSDYLLGRKDIALEDIPNLVYRKGTEIVTAEKTWAESSLENINFIDLDFCKDQDLVRYLTVNGVRLHLKKKQWLCIARGCKFNCGYCCGSNMNMKTLFRRCNILKCSPQKVADDFCRLTSEIGVDQVCPSHDFEMFGEEYYKEIFAKIREKGVKPGMYLECFQLPSVEYLKDIMATFNMDETLLVISPISGSERLRKKNGKLFTNDELYTTLQFAKENGIKILVYYTFNLVGETREEFMDTIFQMQYLRMNFRYVQKQILYQSVVIDPLAPMRSFDKIKADYNTFMDYYNHCQLPNETKYYATGYDDGGEVSPDEKLAVFESIFK